MTTERPSLGQIAYEAYAERRNYRSIAGEPLPSWRLLDDDIRAGWDAAATAVRVAINLWASELPPLPVAASGRPYDRLERPGA